MTKQKFINQWLRHFAKGLSKADFENHIKNEYIWHIFSWKLLNFDNLLEGNAARNAFDLANKSNVICCDMFGGDGTSDKLPENLFTAEKIDRSKAEFYVVAKDYSWTYIKTHETDLYGPYFLKADTLTNI